MSKPWDLVSFLEKENKEEFSLTLQYYEEIAIETKKGKKKKKRRGEINEVGGEPWESDILEEKRVSRKKSQLPLNSIESC